MSYTYEKQEQNELIAEGDYEAIIEKIEIKETPTSHTEYLSLQLRIRNDVEQSNKNRCVFDSIWHEKDNPKMFNHKRINALLGTQKDIKDGQVFETINDVIKFLNGAKVLVHIAITRNDYYGREENTIKYYNTSKVVNNVLGGEEKKDPVLTNLTDDDLPF